MVNTSEMPPKDKLPRDIAEMVEGTDSPEEGFFGPDSTTWKVTRENAVLLAGVAAALLQVGHPKVATGVNEHSEYESDTVGRFKRTFEIVDAVTFGDVPSAVRASVEVRGIHRNVFGKMSDGVGSFDEGERYYANDPDLLLWVYATLVEQALVGYNTYVGELTQREHEEYYENSKVFARLMGIPESHIPESLDGFYEYYRGTIEHDITVSDEGKRIKDSLFYQYRPLAPVLDLLAGGTLPAKARVEFGIKWSPARRRAFERFAQTARSTVPRLPDAVRYNSEYRKSLRRLGLNATGEGKGKVKSTPPSGKKETLWRVIQRLGSD